jgi:ribosomal protein L29
MEEDISKFTNSELKEKMNDLNQKYLKLRKLAIKVASEMDSLSEQYQILKQEENNRSQNISE